MLTAKEAKEKAQQVIESGDTPELFDVLNDIEDAVKNGEFYIVLDARLRDSTVSRLFDLGYSYGFKGIHKKEYFYTKWCYVVWWGDIEMQ